MSGANPPVPPGLPAGYRLLRRLGRGAYGEVWRAEAPGGVEVALKLIPCSLKSEEAKRELNALQRIKGLRHQNLISLQAFFVQEEQLVIVLELADRSLRERLTECVKAGDVGIPPAELLAYFREAAEALDYLHDKDVQHRDVKSENLLLLGQHIKVADCGLARMLERLSLQSASTVGTPAYMAPEVWEGKVSLHSDQYSLAVTYAELRLGRFPFPTESLPRLIHCHLHGEPDLAPLADGEKQVLLRALAKTPDSRYPSCLQFAQELARAVVHELTHDTAEVRAPATARRAEGGKQPAAHVPSTATFRTGQPGDDRATAPAEVQGGTLAPEPGTPRAEAGPGSHTLRETAASHGTLVENAAGAQAAPQGDWRGQRQPRRRRGVVLAAGCLLAAAVGLLAWKGPALFEGASPPSGPAQAKARPNEDDPPKGVKPPPAQNPGSPPPKKDGPTPPPASALRLLPLEAVTLDAGKGGSALVRVQRENCKGPVQLRLEGLPTGVRALTGAVEADTDSAFLHLAADDDAEDGPRDVTVRAELGALKAEQKVRVTVRAKVGLRLATVKDVILEPGQKRAIRVQFQGRRVAGPVEVYLENLPPGAVAWRGSVAADRDVGGIGVTVRKYARPATVKARLVAVAAGLRAEQEFGFEIGPPRAKEDRLAEDSEAIKQSPKDPVAHQNRAETYHEMGENERALADFDAAIRLDAKYAPAYLGRGLVYFSLREYEKAIADYSEAIALDAKSPAGLNGRGDVYRAQRDYDQALADYDAALRAEPDCALAWRNRGLTYSFRKAYDQAIMDYTEAIRVDPGYALPYYNRGTAHVNKGEDDRALDDFTEAIRLDPSLTGAYYARGNLSQKRREYARAVEDYDAAIRLAPRLAGAYYNRANAQRARNEFQKAIDDYSEAIRLSPGYVAAYVNRGNTYRLLRDYDRALQDCTEAIRLAPREVHAYNTRGLAYSGKKDYERAIADFSQAIRLDPKLVFPHHNRGNAHFARKEYDAAIKDFDEVLRLSPKAAAVYNDRGAAYSRKGDPKRAIQDYSEAIRLNPKFALAYANRCRAYRTVGDLTRARQDRERAIQLDPSLEQGLPPVTPPGAKRLPPSKSN
jgi:tetratricopeptide (TPR) repeat protein